MDDHERHFETLLPAFDKRYIRVDGKPLFCVYRAGEVPDGQKVWELWRKRGATSRPAGPLHRRRSEFGWVGPAAAWLRRKCRD